MDQTPVNFAAGMAFTQTGRYPEQGVMAFLLLESRLRARDY
jgi:hypothetical protein